MPSKIDPKLIELRQNLAMTDLEKTYELTLSLFKWFTTTALAVNLGALLACLSSPFAKSFLSGPAWLFVAGSTFALASGLALIRAFADLGAGLFDAIWANQGFEAPSYDDFGPKSGSSWIVVTAGVLLGLSVLSFTIGCVWGGLDMRDALKRGETSVVTKQ